MFTFFKVILFLATLYIVFFNLAYLFQEKIIFHPQKLESDYKFTFHQPYEEVLVKAKDGKILNGLLFKAENSKGVVFYLHGNAGSLASWGLVAGTYTNLGYDVFMLDYRGYGKSEGKITSERQLYDDVQHAYNLVKSQYDENKIVILGYSIGTGPAAYLASTNHPRMLILQAPYFNLTDMMKHTISFLPTFILKYKFETNEYIQKTSVPIVIFHGTNDEVIYYESSLKLQALFKEGDVLITLKGEGHNGMSDNPEYKAALARILGAQ